MEYSSKLDQSDIIDYGDIMSNYDPKKNKTKNILSKYEKVKILGIRTEQLQRGSEPLIKWEGEFDPRRIAKEELEQRKTPFMIRRKLPDDTVEYFRLDDMIILWANLKCSQIQDVWNWEPTATRSRKMLE